MSGERRGNMDKIKKLEALIKHLEAALEESQRLLKEIKEDNCDRASQTTIIADGIMWKMDPVTEFYLSASGEVGLYDSADHKMIHLKRCISSDGNLVIKLTRRTIRVHPMIARAWIDPKYQERGFVVKFNDGNALNCNVSNIDVVQRNENSDDSKNMTRLSCAEVNQICTALVVFYGDVPNTFRYARAHIRKSIAYQTIVNIRDKKRHEEISDKFFYMTANDVLIPVVQIPEKTKEHIKRAVSDQIYKELVELRK